MFKDFLPKILVAICLLFPISALSEPGGDLNLQNKASLVSRNGYDIILGTEGTSDSFKVVMGGEVALNLDAETGLTFSGELNNGLSLPNDTWIKTLDAAGTGLIDVLKVNSSDDTVLNADGGDYVRLAIAGTIEASLDTTNFSPAGVAGNALGLVGQPWLQLITGAVAIDADVTAVTGVNVGLVTAKNTSSDADTAAFIAVGANNAGSVLKLFKTRANTTDANTIVNASDVVGQVSFLGADGASYRTAAAIIATVDGTPGSSDMPGALDFHTTPDGSATTASVLKLSNNKQATFGGAISFSTAASQIIPGGTSLSLRNNANSADNILITDAGVVTTRSNLVANTGYVRTLGTGSGSDFQATGAGATLAIQEATASAACSGTVTANGTTPVVTSTTCWTTGSRVFLTKSSTSAVNGSCYISATSSGVSFTITCLATDTGTYNWFIIHEAP